MGVYNSQLLIALHNASRELGIVWVRHSGLEVPLGLPPAQVKTSLQAPRVPGIDTGSRVDLRNIIAVRMCNRIDLVLVPSFSISLRGQSYSIKGGECQNSKSDNLQISHG